SIDEEASITSITSSGFARPVHWVTSSFSVTQLTCAAFDETGVETIVAVAIAVSVPLLAAVYTNVTFPSTPVAPSSEVAFGPVTGRGAGNDATGCPLGPTTV